MPWSHAVRRDIFIAFAHLLLYNPIVGLRRRPDASAGAKNRSAVAWMYLADSPEPNSTYASLPEEWDRVDYTVVDRLIIGPLGIQSDGHFGLVGDEGKFGSLDDRFDRVQSDARRSNPSIEIEVSIWWQAEVWTWWHTGSQCPQTEWGRSLCALQAGEEERFASEVIGFLEQHDLFGFNIDYEASNVQPTFAELGRAIRAAFGDDYNFSVSPASTAFLDSESLGPVDAIYMQSYAGGSPIPLRSFTSLTSPDRVYIGLCPETNCESTLTPQHAAAMVNAHGLGGAHLWRLNSDNWEYELEEQREIYELLHA